MGWKKQTATDRIQRAVESCDGVTISDLVRETDLTSLPLTKAYRVKGAHIYVDITNASKLLNSDASESEQSHKRFLRFLHILQRVAHVNVFSDSDAVKVDFQNARLHFIVYRPYDDARKRAVHAVAVAAELAKLISGAGALHDELANPVVSVGIESGISLAVHNGTRGDREALFVGHPANRAAHLLGEAGIYLGENARADLGIDDDATRKLSDKSLADFIEEADLSFDSESLLDAWNSELAEAQQADFEFSRPTPPLSSLSLEDLTPGNSRRINAISLVADIDGFTEFVDHAFANGKEAEAVKILHVARKELRDVLADFGGKKIRYVGDAIHGVLAEGTASTDLEATVTSGAVCAAAMRSSFDLIKELVLGAGELGLSIGLELGPIAITRLGVKGQRSKCVAGRAVIGSELLQRKSSGSETRLGETAVGSASGGVKAAFPKGVSSDLNFAKLVGILKDANESVRSFGVESVAPVQVSYPRAHTRE